jgi:hypothetical protein
MLFRVLAGAVAWGRFCQVFSTWRRASLSKFSVEECPLGRQLEAQEAVVPHMSYATLRMSRCWSLVGGGARGAFKFWTLNSTVAVRACPSG